MNEVVRTELLRLREHSDGNGLVFRSPKTGEKLVDIKKGFKAACEDAGIKEFRFHDLRHTTGTRLGDVGTVATTIADILGHSDLRMTKRYTQVADPNKQRAVDALANYGRENGDCQKIAKISERRVG
jgi:integrase